MKIFVMTDLEGATGVAGTWEDFNPGGREHDSARRFLTGDVNAAVEGAIEAGVDEIVVLDGHGAAFSIIFEDLNPKAQLIRGRRRLELEGLDATFNLMFAVGAHSMAGTPNGILTHTLSSTGIDNIWLNGRPIGEIGLWATIGGHFDVPLGLVVGDLAVVEEARSLLGDIETVAVKVATSRFAARCLHPSVTRELIFKAAKKAVLRAGDFAPYKPETPMELKVEFHNSETAERISQRGGVKRLDGRTVSCRGDNILELMSTLLG